MKGGIDADSWRRIRDVLINAQWLKRLDRGHYLLSRDLHEVTLAMLAQMMRAEPDYHLNSQHLGWQKDASSLLREMRDQEAAALNLSLAALFGEGNQTETRQTVLRFLLVSIIWASLTTLTGCGNKALHCQVRAHGEW